MENALRKKMINEKGFTGMDLSISVIVILISVSIIVAMFYNLYLSGSGMKRNVVATDYAINILETIQSCDYDIVTFDSNEDESLELKTILTGALSAESSTIIENNIYNTIVNNYNIKVKIEKYSDRFNEENAKQDYIKIVTVTIEYNLGKNLNGTNTEKLEISTLKTIK